MHCIRLHDIQGVIWHKVLPLWCFLFFLFFYYPTKLCLCNNNAIYVIDKMEYCNANTPDPQDCTSLPVGSEYISVQQVGLFGLSTVDSWTTFDVACTGRSSYPAHNLYSSICHSCTQYVRCVCLSYVIVSAINMIAYMHWRGREGIYQDRPTRSIINSPRGRPCSFG